MFGIDPDKAPYKSGRHILFDRTFNGQFYKVKGTFRDHKLIRLDVWKREDVDKNDHRRRELFRKGDKDPRYQLKPGYRDYKHHIFKRINSPEELWKKGVEGKELRGFGGLKGGMVHDVEKNRLSNREVKRAKRGIRDPKHWRA